MHKASPQRGAWEGAPSPGSQLTLQRDDGEVLCRLGLAGGEALVGAGVALLGGRDEEGLVADAPDGDVVIHRHQVRVAVPADDVLGGPAEGTREDDGAADARFELLWCEGHTQRVCERGERCWQCRGRRLIPAERSLLLLPRESQPGCAVNVTAQ